MGLLQHPNKQIAGMQMRRYCLHIWPLRSLGIYINTQSSSQMMFITTVHTMCRGSFAMANDPPDVLRARQDAGRHPGLGPGPSTSATSAIS